MMFNGLVGACPRDFFIVMVSLVVCFRIPDFRKDLVGVLVRYFSTLKY